MSRSPMPIEDYLRVGGDTVVVIERAREPSALLARIAGLAPWLTLIHVPDEGQARLRAEGRRPHGEITFMGPVEGRLVEVLVELIRALSTGQIPFDTPATPGLLSELAQKRFVGVHVTASCPYCPAVARAALLLALGSPFVDVAVIRAAHAPSPRVLATPSVIVDGELVATGPIGEYALAERVVAGR
mgnify:CR=1 FL=1